jgi:hypothetical protein
MPFIVYECFVIMLLRFVVQLTNLQSLWYEQLDVYRLTGAQAFFQNIYDNTYKNDKAKLQSSYVVREMFWSKNSDAGTPRERFLAYLSNQRA